MNKGLMMMAAVQFKGVWPDEEETHLYKFHYGRFVTGMAGGTADVICTREQFKAFVAEFYADPPITCDTPEQLKEGVKPQAPWVPKIGDRCSILEDYILCGSTPLKIKKGDTVIVKAIVDLGYGEIALITDESILGSGTIIFSQLQKIKTERELFIEQAIEDYLERVGSDAVNAKWFGRVFGAMYDAGYTKGDAK